MRSHYFLQDPVLIEDKGISPRTSMPFSNPPFSNIREHALSFDHPIKVDNFSVLASHDPRFESMSFVVNILACKLKIVNNRN